jgi:hypothetical protein
MLARQSGMTAANIVIAYWLVPAEPARTFFASITRELAARFPAPVFEPHLTVYAGPGGAVDPNEVLSRALAEHGPLQLSVRDVRSSDQFTKTVFVQFEDDPRLAEISFALRRASADDANYELNPHLSLIYKTMETAVKSELANSIRIPFREVTFDSAKAVACPSPMNTRADVEAWRVVAIQSLAK